MSSHEGAVNVCLEKISESVPVIFGMLGHRIGWCPSLDFVSPEFETFLSTQQRGMSLTELEIQYSTFLLPKQSSAKTVVFLRSKTLSLNVLRILQAEGHEIAQYSLDDIDTQRERLLKNKQLTLVKYDSFAEFESLAESSLNDMLIQFVNTPKTIFTNAKVSSPTLDRALMLQAIAKKTKAKPTLIYGTPGCGKTWLAKRWLGLNGYFWQKDIKPKYVDLRQQQVAEIGQPLAGHDINTEYGLSNYLQSLPKRTKLVLDHFEDGFSGIHAADLTFIPSQYKHIELCLCTADKSIYNQAKYLGWQTIEVTSPSIPEIKSFVVDYLYHYGKSLSEETIELLACAKWSNSFANIKLVLDELRRFGIVEKLDDYAKQLSSLANTSDIVEHVLANLDSALPKQW